MTCLWHSQVRHGLPGEVLFVMSSAVSATEPGAVVATLRQIAERIPRLRAQGSRVSEQDTIRILITPAIAALGWDTLDSVFGDRRPRDSLPDDLLLGPRVSQPPVPRQASAAARTRDPRLAAPSKPSGLRRCARAGAALTGPADSGESLGCAPRRGTSGPGTGKAAPQPGRGVSLSGVGRDARRLRQGLGRAQISWRSRRWW
jgi:hypothetical protein